MNRTPANFFFIAFAGFVLCAAAASSKADDFDDLGDLSAESQSHPIDWEPIFKRFIVIPRSADAPGPDDPKPDQPKPGEKPEVEVLKPLKLDQLNDTLPSVKAAWDAVAKLIAPREDAYFKSDPVPSSFDLRLEQASGKRSIAPYMHLAKGTEESPIQTLLASEDVRIAFNIDLLMSHIDREARIKNFEVLELTVLAYRLPEKETDLRAALGVSLADVDGLGGRNTDGPKPTELFALGDNTNAGEGKKWPDVVSLFDGPLMEFRPRTPGLVEFRMRLRVRGTINGVKQIKMANGAVRVRFTNEKVDIDTIGKEEKVNVGGTGGAKRPQADPGPANATGGGNPQ